MNDAAVVLLVKRLEDQSAWVSGGLEAKGNWIRNHLGNIGRD